jgi:hypothetical protein
MIMNIANPAAAAAAAYHKAGLVSYDIIYHSLKDL